ncbi:hypothetical protein GOP47_0014003 [Adiantum capillus-veneris]|uniref:Pentatricopeptide repeat-containing protein n=1 Tax=Adiantum capillus-veneris TaxID=13818 RepID=A0A9D4ZCY7_ADICA|nr:hypothetical protein GOP47_0013209 [Adiantum capillus-veneris]KAI5071752.1 hypothetical protein GOP47_0014003 [Adiantum capillus-veneris]
MFALRKLVHQISPALAKARSKFDFPTPLYVRSSFVSGASPSPRSPPLPGTGSPVKQDSTCLSEEVATVFSDLVQSMVPDAPSRKALFDLKRSLPSAQHPSDFASAISRHSALFLKPHSWLFFLEILGHGSNPAHAIQAFEWKMVQPNVDFTPQEYALVIRVAGKLGMLEKVKALYHGMPSRGVQRTIDVENAYMYAHTYDSVQNDCVEALKLFKCLRDGTDGIAKPNLTSFNIAMSCYSKLRHLQYLEKTFDELIGAGCSPSVQTYNCLMLAYRRLGFWWRVEEIFGLMQSASLKPNALTFRTLVRGYAASGLLDRMEKAHEAMLNHGYPLTATTAEAVIAAYKKAGELAKMERILFSMKARCSQRNMLKIMLSSHACNGKIDNMEVMVYKMMKSGDIPFSPQLAEIIVKAYFRNGEHEKIKTFVEAAQACEWNLNRSFFNTLIYLYAQNVDYVKMKWYFEKMVTARCRPNCGTFHIMHRAYSKGNMHKAAQDVLIGMRAMGLS